MEARHLTPVEARVLGTIIEKEYLVPGKYPITLSVLTAGCIQRTNRDPLMTWILRSDVLAALANFKSIDLVTESKGRVALRYAHNVSKILHVPELAVPLLGVLLLRGPQTAPQLRVNVETMHRFSSADQIDSLLLELHHRGEAYLGKPLVSKLPRIEGEREGRWSEVMTRSLRGVRPKPTREELIYEVEILRSKLEFIEKELGIAKEFEAPYDNTRTSLFDD